MRQSRRRRIPPIQTTIVAAAAAISADDHGDIPDPVNSAKPGTGDSPAGSVAAATGAVSGTRVRSLGSPSLATSRLRPSAANVIASP